MSLIKLDGVSKFYYSKGVIASGFSKVNLSFDIGEFVAITGESGSGKSTLLNVISGLDTYEEGEMYINGEETSHYTEKDFEEYRRKYIGNIFQSFNLVNSYTVYQNIELVLLLNGCKKKEVKNQVLDLIRKVDLYKFRNTKVSKLSGGQKQRVAIARALAKDTPMIIADEPTGNLDSRSAEGIIKLLSEISEYKLVIVVTHNYDQIEKYVTRKIKMHDGKVIEDEELKKSNVIKNSEGNEYKDITFLNKLRLSIRNTFNIIPKFLLLLLVYFFMTVALISEYAGTKELEYTSELKGYNYAFRNTSDKRIVIKKKDGSSIIEEDFNKISKLENIDYVIKNDFILDRDFTINDGDSFWLTGTCEQISNNIKVDLGNNPVNDNEIVISANKEIFNISYGNPEEFLNKEFKTDLEEKVKIVGFIFNDEQDYEIKFHLSEKVITLLLSYETSNISETKVLFLNKYRENQFGYFLAKSSKVPKGKVYIDDLFNIECPKFNCVNQNVFIEINNLYYYKTLNLQISKTYNKNNMKSLLNKSYDEYSGYLFINEEDFNNLYLNGVYQSSVFVKDVKNIDKTIVELNNIGLSTLKIKDTLITDEFLAVVKIFRTCVTVFLIIALIFISYFVIKIILKSRNKYFSTLRMLGATKELSKELLIYELLTISNIAFFGFMLLIHLHNINIININFINIILAYLNLKDYIILYILLMIMSFIISSKFAKKLFKKSAITTLAEEV